MEKKWEKTPVELAEFLAETMKNIVAEPRKMFGYPVYFINGNMVIGAFGAGLFLRIDPKEQEAVFKKHKETGKFEPMPGRVMKEYIMVGETVYRNNKEFGPLLLKSLNYAASLPPKVKKRKKTVMA